MTIEHLKNDQREREREISIDSTVCCWCSSSSFSVTTAISQTIVYLCIHYILHMCECECVWNVYKIKRKKWESIILTVWVHTPSAMSILYQFIRSLKTLQLYEMPVIMWSFSVEVRGRETHTFLFFVLMCFRYFWIVYSVSLQLHSYSFVRRLMYIDIEYGK